MSRIVHRPISVSRWDDDEPLIFLDRDEMHEVRLVLDRWMEMGWWWLGEGERKMLRVWTDRQALFDLELDNQQWYIYKTWD